MATFIVEKTIDDVEVTSTVTVEGKSYIKELLIDGVEVTRVGDTKNKFLLEKDGFIREVSPYHTENDYEMVKDLKERVQDFIEYFRGWQSVPDDNLHKYLTLGELREMLKDYPDDSLLVGTENNLVQSIKVGYITEKVRTQHSLSGGFDYEIRKFYMKDEDLVAGWVNSEDYSHPEHEEDLRKMVEETKESVKDFASNRSKYERVGIQIW